jgi:hypothetical protein
MSVLRYSLLVFPIHHYSYEKYYERHNEYIEKEKIRLGKFGNYSFDRLSDDTKRMWEMMWWWPPWKFNDIVGFIEIGMDIGDCLTADIFLQRKYLPKQHPSRRIGQTAKTHDFLYFCEINKVPVRGEDNRTYIEAFKKIIIEAKRTLRKRNKSFKLFLFSYDYNCFNFARAHKFLMDNEKYE